MKFKKLSLVICQANRKDPLGLSRLIDFSWRSQEIVFYLWPFLDSECYKKCRFAVSDRWILPEKKINCFRNPHLGALPRVCCAYRKAALKRLNLFCFIVGLVNKFLSASYWIPLSRLTYSAYLLHPIVMNVYFGSFQHTTEYTDKIFVSSFNISSLCQYLLLMLLL